MNGQCDLQLTSETIKWLIRSSLFDSRGGVLTQFSGGDDQWAIEKGPQRDRTMVFKKGSTRSAIPKSRCNKRENRGKIDMKTGLRCCKMLILVPYLPKIAARSAKILKFCKVGVKKIFYDA